MNRHLGVATAVLLAGSIVGCDRSQPAEPVVAGTLFAAATQTAATATVGPLTVTVPGRIWVADGILHIRRQVQTGSVTGDLEGSITVVVNANAAEATLDGTGWGTFTITGAGGVWEGSFEGRFAGGLFSGRLVAHGTGSFDGLKLQGTFAETGAVTNTYALTAEILDPGS